MSTTSQFWPEARVKIVPRYRHLGGILHHKSGLEFEAKSRAAQAWQAFQKHRKTIFMHANVYLADKVVLFGTLVLSTLFHACGTWGRVEGKARAVLTRAYLNMARAILSKHYIGDVLHLSEDRVFALLRLPTLSTWLHFHTLSYLASFVSIDEPLAWALAHAEGHWLSGVRDSLHWLWRHVDRGQQFVSWEEAWQRWSDDIRSRPRVWKRLIKRGRDAAARLEILSEGWQQCRGLVLKRLVKAGGYVPAQADDFGVGGYACGPCQKVFASRQAWSVHAFKVHGRIKPSRLFVAGEQCPICLRHYASNIQLCLHVERSTVCRRRLQAGEFVCAPQPGRGSKDGTSQAEFLGVSKQGCGPLPAPVPDLCAEALPDLSQHAIWSALTELLEFQGLADQQLLEQYRRAFCVACECPDTLKRIAAEWLAHLRSGAWDDMPLDSLARHGRVALWVVANLCVSWLVPEHDHVCLQNITFRQSVEGLASLETGDIVVELPSLCVPSHYLVVCEKAKTALFARPSGEEVSIITIEECIADPNWCDRIWSFLQRHPDTLLITCITGLPVSELPLQPPVCAKTFDKELQGATLAQDTVLLVVETWLRAFAHVALLPCPDGPLRACLKGLPGLGHIQGGSLLLLRTVPEASIPGFLFHFLN